MPDPLQADGSEAEVALALADAYRMLYGRITVFTNLPLASLNQLALQESLEAIGRSGRDPEGRRST